MSEGFDMDQYELELDKMMAGVLPDTHEVHGTIAIRESDLSGDKVDAALGAFGTLREKEQFAMKPSTALARTVIKRVEEKL